MDKSKLSCSLDSLQKAEPLIASVNPARHWLLVEYNAAWSAKAYAESTIPQEVKSHLDFAQKSLGSSRLLLIRQQPRQTKRNLRFFLAVADEHDPSLFEFQFTSYAEILQLDLPAIVNNPGSFREQQRHEPLFLVCTNGKRDLCCATHGLPVYRALASEPELEVWQTSHVGGHRFAANLVCLPHAFFYGRVKPTTASHLAAAYRHGHLDLEHFRGRGCYPEVVQAAEYYLRSQENLTRLDELTFLASKEQTPGKYLVSFRQIPFEITHTVHLEIQPDAYEVFSSCRDQEPGKVDTYRLLEIF
jgi:hypothetical protein